MAGESLTIEKQLVLTGKRIDVEIIATPVRNEHRLVVSVSYFGRDISARKQAEAELVRAREQTEQTPGEVVFPGNDEPRDPHAAQWRDRHG